MKIKSLPSVRSARAAKIADFLKMKIYLIGSIVPLFESRQQVLYHSTLTRMQHT